PRAGTQGVDAGGGVGDQGAAARAAVTGRGEARGVLAGGGASADQGAGGAARVQSATAPAPEVDRDAIIDAVAERDSAWRRHVEALTQDLAEMMTRVASKM